MRRALALISILFMFTGNAWADGNRAGVQFDSGGNLGVIYYGDDNGWAVGGGLGLSDLDINKRGIPDDDGSIQAAEYRDYDEIRTNFFIRKNFKIHAKTYLGLGVTSAFAWGSEDREYGSYNDGGLSNVEIDTTSWSVAPYLIIDHHITEHIVLNAGATLVTFKETRRTGSADYTDANGDEVRVDETLGKVTSEEYFNPFFGMTYLF